MLPATQRSLCVKTTAKKKKIKNLSVCKCMNGKKKCMRIENAN